MSARTATKKVRSKGLDTSLLVDGEYSSREAVVEMRSGPIEQQVTAKAEIKVVDGEDDKRVATVLVHWAMGRDRYLNGNLTREETQSDGLELHLDEVEAWTTALHRAVQLAKKEGYLPTIGGRS